MNSQNIWRRIVRLVLNSISFQISLLKSSLFIKILLQLSGPCRRSRHEWVKTNSCLCFFHQIIVWFYDIDNFLINLRMIHEFAKYLYVVIVWDLTAISYSNIFQTLCFYHKIISKALLCATKYCWPIHGFYTKDLTIWMFATLHNC